MKLVFLGPPGSGKGTYASRIEERFGWPQISTGDLLREEVKKGSEIGREAEKYMKEGKLVPDEIVLKLLKERISREDCKNGFILDGFPRTLAQAEELEKITDIDVVINLVVPKEIIVTRLSARRVCRNCGAVYNLRTLKPKVDGICDKCGGELYQRKDDTPEVIEKRFEVYHEQTAPLIDFYRKKGILIDIECNDPDVPPEIMVDKIIEKLKEINPGLGK
ncbi:MAG TPA: adenylate kinase [Candidatus Aenigmarchaeota archaeon]|nr:adenylate kinase [Candidatus Aenigmarchaeota archaeon]